MLVHRRVNPNIKFAGTHLYTWVERVNCLAQDHNTMSPARARTRTARSGVVRSNHEATAPPTGCSRDNANSQVTTIRVCTRFLIMLAEETTQLKSNRCPCAICISSPVARIAMDTTEDVCAPLLKAAYVFQSICCHAHAA